MESIKEKLQKIKVLAERGETHEAEAAKKRLEILLNKHGLQMSDLEDTHKEEYRIHFKNRFELTLLVGAATAVIGSERSGVLKYVASSNELILEATPWEYANIASMFAWHTSNYRRERKKILKQLQAAYIYRQGIEFPENLRKDDGGSMTEEEIRDIRETISLSEHLSANTYHKQLKK